MLCQNPFTRGMHAFPCGRCMPCRFNRRRTWTHRIMLEAAQHGDNAFLTLTYADQFLPLTNWSTSNTYGQLPTLEPRHMQLFLKRLRWEIAPARIRFYAVGEYGDDGFRPHYHAALFGLPTCARGITRRVPGTSRSDWARCCAQCRLVGDIWGKGDVELGTLETSSAEYLCGSYVTKMMTHSSDPRLQGRHPEFGRMSLRPGIGCDAMHEVASTLIQYHLDERQADVPASLEHGGRALPLGRYLRRKLRTMIGKEENAPLHSIIKQAEEMRPLLEASRTDPKNFTLKKQLVAQSKGKVASLIARAAIYKKRKTL